MTFISDVIDPALAIVIGGIVTSTIAAVWRSFCNKLKKFDQWHDEMKMINGRTERQSTGMILMAKNLDSVFESLNGKAGNIKFTEVLETVIKDIDGNL
jgi:hypothetical protein